MQTHYLITTGLVLGDSPQCTNIFIFLVEEKSLVFMATQFYKWQGIQEVALLKSAFFFFFVRACFPLANGVASTNDVSRLPVLPVPGTLPSPSFQQRSNHSGVSKEKQSTVHTISRPRPSSLRSKIDAWQIIPRMIKPNSKDSECLEGSVDPGVNFLPDTEQRTNCHMPSLLDIDVEGQNRDCTVPLCRMKSKTCRPSIYELEREFLS